MWIINIFRSYLYIIGHLATQQQPQIVQICSPLTIAGIANIAQEAGALYIVRWNVCVEFGTDSIEVILNVYMFDFLALFGSSN